MKHVFALIFLAAIAACGITEPLPLPNVEVEADRGALTVETTCTTCSNEYNDMGGWCGYTLDVDRDCWCGGEDNCPVEPNCDQADADGDGYGDVCDEWPNTPDPEAALAALTVRVQALEAALLME